MSSDSRLEQSIDKILAQHESELLAGLKDAHGEAQEKLAKSRSSMEDEYDRIIDEGKKEAEKIAKQIVGSSNLQARNKQLLLVQQHIDGVLEKAIEKIRSADRNNDYSKFISSLISESVAALGTPDVIISTSAGDKKTVKSVLGKFAGAKLSADAADCLGGVYVKSKDGSMSYDNTIDSRIERMKPLIRKEIANKFGIGS